MNLAIKNSILTVIFIFFLLNTGHTQPDTGKVRIIMFGAHPDDCDYGGGGTAAIFASMGYAVKFVAVTNGDAGHQTQKGPELAARRFQEAQESARRLSVSYDILDNHDGQLMPTLEVRMQVIKKIREWKADIVISPRPNDYHPDHRYTGVLVQDAAYMVAVPNTLPETPALKKNPLFLYFQDRFQRPNPFRPDIAVDITNFFDKKIDGLDAHVSQVYEWLPWIGHYSQLVPKSENDRKKWLKESQTVPVTPEIRNSLIRWYGREHAEQTKHAEAFEICEYGIQPGDDEIRRMFPMLGHRN